MKRIDFVVWLYQDAASGQTLLCDIIIINITRLTSQLLSVVDRVHNSNSRLHRFELNDNSNNNYDDINIILSAFGISHPLNHHELSRKPGHDV